MTNLPRHLARILAALALILSLYVTALADDCDAACAADSRGD
jgi:hypothetical protein